MVTNMKPANATFGGTPNNPSTDLRANRPRARSRVRPPLDSTEVERSAWGRCEENGTSEVPSRGGDPAKPEEPRTGVLRRDAAEAPERESGLLERTAARGGSNDEARAGRPREGGGPDGWRCLSWDRTQKERRVTSHSKVTIVQLSRGGDLVRQNGPDAWLPDAGDFVHRMARLVAHGLGFERCRSLCLRGPQNVMTVSEAGERQLVAVSGPLRSMMNVLRRAGLE
jgi:hypothetical protein